MRTLAAVLTLALIAIPARPAADPSLLSLLPPDSAILGGFRLDDAQNAPAVALILDRLAGETPLIHDLGFDPRTDLHEVVMGGVKDAGLVAARGNFPVNKLTDLLKAQQGTVEDYHGFSVISHDDKTAAAFLDSGTFLIGNPAQVRAAIDRWVAHSTDLPVAAQSAINTSSTSQAWGVATDLASLINLPVTAGDNQQAQVASNVISKISQLAGGIQFTVAGATVHGQIQSDSAEDAQALADVVQLLQISAPQTPQGDMLQRIQVAVNGAAVNITLTVPEAQLEQMFQIQQPVRPLAASAVTRLR